MHCGKDASSCGVVDSEAGVRKTLLRLIVCQRLFARLYGTRLLEGRDEAVLAILVRADASQSKRKLLRSARLRLRNSEIAFIFPAMHPLSQGRFSDCRCCSICAGQSPGRRCFSLVLRCSLLFFLSQVPLLMVFMQTLLLLYVYVVDDDFNLDSICILLGGLLLVILLLLCTIHVTLSRKRSLSLPLCRSFSCHVACPASSLDDRSNSPSDKGEHAGGEDQPPS